MAPERGSWVPGADRSGFGIEHLPFGVVRTAAEGPRVAVRIGAYGLDLAGVVEAGLLDVPGLGVEVLRAPDLNGFLGLGRGVWSATWAGVAELLRVGARSRAESTLLALDEVEVLCPVAVGDYVDFYSSLHHAANLGRILRPSDEPVLPNWRHLPVGYHGRAGSIVVSGGSVRRPCGQRAPAEAGEGPSFGPERRLDFELELGFVTGASVGAIHARDAAEHIFGFLLVNDWSAREIQRWEAQPLGPFLGKSFATSIAGWITPLEALAAHRVPGPRHDPPVLPYLRTEEPWAFDIELEVALVPAGASEETVVTRTNARELYWNAAQQLAHATSGGAPVRPGDLFASGTISGPEPGGYGSLIELTENGRRPLVLSGTTRTFLEDGDAVIMRGACPATAGRSRIELGEVQGRVSPAAG